MKKTLLRIHLILLSLALISLSYNLGTAAATSSLLPFTTTNDSSSLVPDPTRISFLEVVGGLTNPIFITNAGDGSDRLFILERSGKIRIIKNGTLLPSPFLDIQTDVKSTSGEQGLLGLTFHPSYASNGKFYVTYTAPRNGDTNGSVLTLKEFTVSANPDLADAASGTTLLTIEHPIYSNHNGGTLSFGGDGYLYWSTGDGGGGGDPNNNAQDLTKLLGKIIRIDVDSAEPYAVPTSNPFYTNGNPNTKLIWAYGLRNPWRMSFDRATHDLYIGDVGQNILEEIDFQLAGSAGGENYGWDVMEGSQCYDPATGCNQAGKILPVAEYNHTLGCSVTGGYVYRGRYPSLNGHYFYGDFCSGRIFSIYKNGSSWSAPLQIADTTYNITTFGEDEDGELYLADYSTGKIYIVQYDESLPYVMDIVTTDENPTSATNIDFTVTFSEPVTEVDATDFSLTMTGVSGALVSNVSGNGNSYIVTVDTGSGDGTIRLNLIDDDSIVDSDSNPLGGIGAGNGDFMTGETYTILPPPPENDDFDNAISLSIPAIETVDTRGATQDFDDPAIPACNINDGGKATVWYQYTSSVNTAITLDTESADYDTFIAVWTGARGSLQPVTCNDDASGTKQSAVAFQVEQDTTYYIEIGQP